MITRRGSLLWSGKLGDAILMYKPGDIVKPVIVTDQLFSGVVRAVDTKINKVTVAWGGGPESQHDPDELMPMPFFDCANKSGTKTASRRMQAEDVDDLLGVNEEGSDPEETTQTDFLADDMESLLNRQVGVEFYSAYLYFMVAAVFQSKGLVGFQAWMERQGDDEIDHAMKVYKYLVDTGSSVELPEIASPAIDPGMEVLALTRAVLDHEMKVTGDWKAIGQLAKKQDDPATCKLVQDFMNEQIEEEDAALTLHQKVQLADSGSGILLIDNDLKDRDPNAIKASEKTAGGKWITKLISPSGDEFWAAYGPMVKEREKATRFNNKDAAEKAALNRFGRSGIGFWESERKSESLAQKKYADWTYEVEEETDDGITASSKTAGKAIELVQKPGEMLETTPRFMMILNGKPYGELYYNMTGYVAEHGIPVPDSEEEGGMIRRHIGERSLSAYKAEIARANREWATKTASVKTAELEDWYKQEFSDEVLWFNKTSDQKNGGWGGVSVRQSLESRAKPKATSDSVRDKNLWKKVQKSEVPADVVAAAEKKVSKTASIKAGLKELAFEADGKGCSGCEATNFLRQATSGDEPPAQRTIWEEMASDSRSSNITRCVDCDKVLEMKNPKSMKENEDGAGYLCLECAKGRRGSVVASDLRRGRLARDPNTDPQYCGNPDKHGINEPRGGGFSIMHDLADDLRKESYDFADVDPRLASLRSRRGMDFDTKKEMDDYKREHDVRPGTKMNVVKQDDNDMSTHPFNLMQQRKNEEKMNQIGKHYKKDPKDLTNDEIEKYNKGGKGKKDETESEMGEGLRLWVKDFNDPKTSPENKKQIKRDIDKVIGEKGLDKNRVYKGFDGRKSSEILIAAGKADLVDKIMQYEGGEMSDDDTVEFFQELIDSGMVHQLQGSYGRMAEGLIRQGLCHRKGQKASTRTATGEMGMHDIQPGGEYYEWAQSIEKAAKEIQKLTKNGIRFQEMRPWDVYQGPYARMTTGKLWSAEEEGMFVLTDIPRGSIEGDPETIAETIMAKFKKASDGCEDRIAAETKLVCNRCGKTLPPIKGYEKASWRHCPCGGVATVKKASSTVAVSADRDLGYTVWFGKQHEDVYAKTREEAKHKGAKALGTTPDKVRVEMFDTNPRGNSTASEIDMTASRRGRLAYADPAELADLPRMTLNQIAGLIYDDWKSVSPSARPYLEAMSTLQNVSDMYMQDSGTSICLYFLSNASGWKSEVARAVKKELQRRCRR